MAEKLVGVDATTLANNQKNREKWGRRFLKGSLFLGAAIALSVLFGPAVALASPWIQPVVPLLAATKNILLVAGGVAAGVTGIGYVNSQLKP